MLSLLALLSLSTVIALDDVSYTHYPGMGYYKFYAENKTWYDAWRTCYDEDAKLVVINSAEEKELISTMIRENGNPPYTNIGFHSLFQKNDSLFVTVNGEKLDNLPYMQWIVGEPDNSRGIQFCGAVDPDALMDDNSCEGLKPFICEIS